MLLDLFGAAGEFVAEILNNFTIDGLRHALGIDPANAFCSIVERLPDEGF